MSGNYFEAFDLPRKLAIDPKDLEKRFYSLSRQLHPDLRRTPSERVEAEEAMAILNDAYRVLRDPVARSEYLLKLEGFDTAQTSKDVPPELLEEVFELNMALEELQAGDTDVLEQLESTRQRFEGMRSELDTELHQKFNDWDSAGRTEDLAAVRSLLNRRKYIANLIVKTNVPDRI
jgi:molecular chaperone HscB